MKPHIFCKICNQQTKYVIDAFSLHHLKKEHNISMKEYYDLYMKKEGEGVCVGCNAPTKYYGTTIGYARYCSRSCYSHSEEYSLAIKESCKTRDFSKAVVKRKKTNIEKYGVESYTSTEEYKKSREETCIARYGVTHNFLTEDCKKKRQIGLSAEGVNEKRKNWWTDENKKKVRETFLSTIDEKYGVTNVMYIDGVTEKIRTTNENNGYWESMDKMDGFDLYYMLVMRETKKHKETLYDAWDGLCYYTSVNLIETCDYLLETPNMNPSNNKLQPTIDHKISIKHGFLNNIPAEVIGHIDNLCICSRSVNSRKSQLTEEEYNARFPKS